jgi:isopentenyldiphosphate isomerase
MEKNDYIQINIDDTLYNLTNSTNELLTNIDISNNSNNLINQLLLLITKKIHTANEVTQMEMVDWISTDGETSILTLPRKEIHKYNLLHSGIGVIVLNNKGEIYIHKRSSMKRIFPSMLDMFIGGVHSSKETYLQTLKREINEELGLDINNIDIYNLQTLKHLTSNKDLNDKNILLSAFISNFIDEQNNINQNNNSLIIELNSTTILTSYNHCYVKCYILYCNENLANSIHFKDGEIEEGYWLDFNSLLHKINNEYSNFVPDGLQVWDAVLKMF